MDGMETGDESLEKTPLAELEFVGIPTEVINLLEGGLSTIWLDDLPSGVELVEVVSGIRNMGPKRTSRVVDAVSQLRDHLRRANQ